MVTEADKEEQKELATNEESDIDDALINQGIDASYLARKVKEEMEAHETKTQIPKGHTEFVYSKPLIAWDVRQKGRQDAHKLRGDYPSEKVEHGGGIIVNIEATPIKKKKSGKEE